MNYTPGPAEQLSQIEDSHKRARIREKLAKESSNHLMGIVKGGREITGYLNLRNFLRGANPLNYGCSKIFEPFETYTSAVQILTERDFKNLGLMELKKEAKMGFLEDACDFFSPFFNEGRFKKRVAKKVLASRCPRFQRSLF